MKKNLFAAAALVGLAGCATPAQTFQFDNQRLVDDSYDAVWDRAINVLANNNLPIKTLEKDSGIIVAENELVSRASMGESASCPQSMMATPIGGAMNYNVLVRRVSDTQSSVTINTRYTMAYRDMNGQTISDVCNSNGNMERKLLNAISGRME